MPWEGREETKTDPAVWAVTCLFTRAGFRRRGVSKALARASVDYARDRGATRLEGYPMTTYGSVLEELHVGTIATFIEAGFVEVGRPTLRRAVVTVDL